MSKVETVSLRIFGRDLTLACPPKEKDNLIKAANLLNEELDNISDKNNRDKDNEAFSIELISFLELTLQDAIPVQAVAKKIRLTILNYCKNLQLVNTALDTLKIRLSMLKYHNSNINSNINSSNNNNYNNQQGIIDDISTDMNNNNSPSSMTSTPEKSSSNTNRSMSTNTNVIEGNVILTGRRSCSQNSNSIDHLSLEKELEDKVFGSSRSPSQVQVVPPSPIPGSPAIGSISGSPMLNNQFDTFDLGAGTPPGSTSPLLSHSPLLRLANMSLYDDSKWHGPQVEDGIGSSRTSPRGSAKDDGTILFPFERRQLQQQQQQQQQQNKRDVAVEENKKISNNTTSTLPRWLVVPSILHRKLVMDVFTPVELADALTALDWELWMASIYPSELLGLTWTKRNLKTIHPVSGGAAHLQRLIQATNQTVVWVATEILHASMEYARGVECISFFVATARQAFKLNNFNAMFVLISALGLPAIRNLKTCWAYIRPSVRKLLEALRSMCSPSSNYTAYRKAIAEIKGEPIVPVFQVALRDLTFVENAGPWFVNENNDHDHDEQMAKEGYVKLSNPKIIDVRKIIATADILDSMLCQYGHNRVELKIMEVDGTGGTETDIGDDNSETRRIFHRNSRVSSETSRTSHTSQASATSSIGSNSTNFSTSSHAPSSYSICIEPCQIPFHESETAALTAKAMFLSRQQHIHNSSIEPIDIEVPYFDYASGSPVPASVKVTTPEDPIPAIARAKIDRTDFDPYADMINNHADSNDGSPSPSKRVASADAKQLAGAGLRYSLPAIPSFLAVKQLYSSNIFELIADNDNYESVNNNNIDSNVTRVLSLSANRCDTNSNVDSNTANHATTTTSTTGTITYSPGWKVVPASSSRNQNQIDLKQKQSQLDDNGDSNRNEDRGIDQDGGIDRTTARKLFSPEQLDGLLDDVTSNIQTPTAANDSATTTSNFKSETKRSTWKARGSRTSVRKKWDDPKRFEIHCDELLVSWLLGIITNSRLEIDDLWHISKQSEKIESARHLASITK